MVAEARKSAWYRIYVLSLLLVMCIDNVAVRNIPSYLITVPVPECETLCAGVASRPLCGRNMITAFPSDRLPNRFEACQLCRARIVPVAQSHVANTTSGANASQANSFRATSKELLPDDGVLALAAAGDGFLLPAFNKNRRQVQVFATDVSAPVASFTQVAPPEIVEEQEPISVSNVPWAEGARQDAAFYNMADGACLWHWEYGLLIGYGFAIIFAVGSISAGVLCDLRPRVPIASAALMAWSVATAMQASAHSFVFLLGCRAVIGLAQAFAMPAAISIAADYFTEKQNIAVAVLSVGLYLGSGCASFSIFFAEALGWRWAVLLAGLIGIAITPVLYHTVQEPERTEWSAPCTLQVVTDEVFEKSRVARMLILAASAKMLAAYTFSAFLPIWYARRGLDGYTNNAYAGWNALAISSGGLLSAVLGSYLGHRWSQWDACAPCWIGLLGAIFSLPLICLVLLTNNFSVSMLCFFLLILVSESWFGPTVGLLQRSVRPSVRFQAVSMFLVASTLAANLGPALVGFLDPGNGRIGLHILWISLTANVAAAAAFMFTAREIMIDPVAATVAPSRGSRDDADHEGSANKAGTAHWAL
jgi:MFS family permease